MQYKTWVWNLKQKRNRGMTQTPMNVDMQQNNKDRYNFAFSLHSRIMLYVCRTSDCTQFSKKQVQNESKTKTFLLSLKRQSVHITAPNWQPHTLYTNCNTNFINFVSLGPLFVQLALTWELVQNSCGCFSLPLRYFSIHSSVNETHKYTSFCTFCRFL
jgi:hypothetical protein